MENEDRTPIQAKNYYSRSSWWAENTSDRNGVNGFYFSDLNNSQEIVTPEISDTFEINKCLSTSTNGVNEISEASGCFSRQPLTNEIVEIVEEGMSSITNKNDRRIDDLYVAVGKDDMDVVKWALHHAGSSGARIFLIHVSPPITLIPTPVGKLERSQLTPQQVRLYVNEVNYKRKELLQKYIQMCNEAKVIAETLLLESNDTGKAILDLISILNITNIVIGIKKLPCTRRSNKLSKAEFIKRKAPKSCEVSLVYNGEVFVSDPNTNGFTSCSYVSQNRSHSKNNFLQCICFSGCVEED